MPKCSRYHSQSWSGLSDLKKIPPMPVMRFILRQHLCDGGLAMNLCRVEQWDPSVIRVAQNQRQFSSGEDQAVDVALACMRSTIASSPSRVSGRNFPGTSSFRYLSLMYSCSFASGATRLIPSRENILV